jgi:dihydroflavonol-4-reductase
MLLVTGATGYLGAVLVTLLRDEGLQPRAVVRAEARAAALPEGVPWAVADLSDREALTRAADG